MGRSRFGFLLLGRNAWCPLRATHLDRMRLFLQRRGDDWSGVRAHEFYRWWSVSNVELAAGKYELSAPLVPDQWFSVIWQTR
jgi:hypothetical protein